MARTGRVNHTHKYYRHENGLWHCAGKEGCSHYVPKNLPPPAGRNSDCWSCDKPFMLTPVNMENDKPMCDECLEKIEMINSLMERKMGPGMDPIERALKTSREKMQRKQVEKDEVEVIEPTHAADCDSWSGGECDCK